MTNDAKLIFEAYTDGRDNLVVPGPETAPTTASPEKEPTVPPTEEAELTSTEARMAKEVIDLADGIKESADRISGLWSNEAPLSQSYTAKKEFTKILHILDHFLDIVDPH